MKFRFMLAVLALGGVMFGQIAPKTLTELQRVTTAKHLYYRIFCNESGSDPDNPDYDFAGWAAYVPMDVAQDQHFAGTGKGFWLEFGRSQQLATLNLLLMLKSGQVPDVPPLRRASGTISKDKMEHRQCPPEISGGPQ